MTPHFAVVAELPLGAYRGRLADGVIDPVPAPARLHGALLQAAAQGTRAVAVGGRLIPRDDDLAALHWVEEHPPDGVRLPNRRMTRAVPQEQQIVYRNEGTLKKEGAMAGPKDKKTAKQFTGVVAVDGPFAWTWSEPPPPGVRDSLGALVCDVSHLGTSESPARLRIGEEVPTHRLRIDASYFEDPIGAVDLDLALPGRATALRELYDAELREPRPAEDRYATSEDPRSRPGWGSHRAIARYAPVQAEEAPPGLWTGVLHARLGSSVPDLDRVAVAVATHRTLIRIIGAGAPSLVTGVYPTGSPRPANRVAIQVLPAQYAGRAALSDESDHLLVMIPPDADPADVTAVAWAFDRLTRVGRYELHDRGYRNGSAFWQTALAGHTRVWATEPVAVPETRIPRAGDWTIAHVVRLAVALAARTHLQLDDAPELPPRGILRYRALADHMAQRGTQVFHGSFLTTSDVQHYVHKTPEHGVVRPYRATLALGPWAHDRWLTAIGQSRHLGGGLLVPVDIPNDTGTGRSEDAA